MRRLGVALAAGVLAVSFVPESANAQPGPGLVAPESLDQGFIIIVTDEAGLAGQSSPIYLASNHVGWNPGDASMRLDARSDGRWQIVLDKPEHPGSMQFKFTRGSWDTCEVAADLADIDNRQLPRVDVSGLGAGERPVIELTIERWADERPEALARRAVDPYRDIDAVGDVRRLQVRGGGGAAAGMVRDILIWLPPGYDESPDRRYPVLYLHDGQNIFEKLPGVPDEWRADETATGLILKGQIEPIIIVGIPHAGAHRTSEYLPVPAYGVEEPGGDEYVEFLTREIMPRVERTFRVSTDRADTAIGGASLGAVISLHAATTHPERFGLLLLESIALIRQPGSPLLEMVESFDPWPERVYIGMGGNEAGTGPEAAELNDGYVAGAHQLHQVLSGKVPSRHLVLTIEPEALHNEVAWLDRFGRALECLFRP